MGIQTDQILKDIENGTSNASCVNFIDSASIRDDVGCDIDRQFRSRHQFAQKCGIHDSHLSDFFNGKKDFGRDKLLSMLITLEYDLERVNSMLKRLGEAPLYVRDRRDYMIANAIRDKKSLDETDMLLVSEHLRPLTSIGAESGRG